MTRHPMAGLAFAQLGDALGAVGPGDRAAGVEVAAGRRPDRVGHVALQHDALALHRRVGNRHGGQQRLGIGMQRVVVELARRRDLDLFTPKS